MELTIAGTARPTRSFYVAERAVLLEENASANVIVTALSSDDQAPPPAVECVTPQGVKWEFEEWRLVYGKDESIKRPARWQGVVRLSRQDAVKAPAGSSIEVQLAGWPAQRVDITGRP